MEEYQIFPSTVWSIDLDLDLEAIRREVVKFKSIAPSRNYSNVGGYQGHCFDYKPLIKAIKDNVPCYEDPELGDLFISTWVNINTRGNSNRRHTHSDGINFLSGVFYLTVPEKSGNIRFYDPKQPVYYSMADLRYYGLGESEHTYVIPAKENRLLYFPCWLEHEVEPNNTDEERISISFNLVRKKDVERYQEILNFS